MCPVLTLRCTDNAANLFAVSVPPKACFVLTCLKSIVENTMQNTSSISSKLSTLNKLNNNLIIIENN